MWSGYLATRSNVGLYHPWSKADFDVARLCGGTPIAYCSGNDDPIPCKNLAQQWGVRLCLDVESGIRADGAWVQGWLNASGAGLYGVSAVHNGRAAPFHIMAWYPGSDPHATWPASVPRPNAPCGWQWRNSLSEFGVTVDRSWLDPWFQGGEDTVTQAEFDGLLAGNKDFQALIWRTKAILDNVPAVEAGPVKGEVNQIRAVLDTLKPGALPPSFNATITPKP